MLEALAATPVRAHLAVHEPPTAPGTTPGARIHRIDLHFNPDRITVTKNATWHRVSTPSGADIAPAQYVGTSPRVLRMSALFDDDGRRGGVQDRVELLLACCHPTPHSAAVPPASPPWVRLEWGRSRTVAFYALVTDVSATYTRFAADGMPLRATCELTLEEVGGTVAGQNPTSRSTTGPTTHRLEPGDSLPLLAWRVYGDPTRWRRIARANDIDDPRRLTTGTLLLLPAPGDDEEPARA
ncbi:CIS tube protein [Embleya hyalina]|uniref:Peptidase M23 n=1 Tax=Embleya hyalina TaxID=516124 RepID=A0A401Z4L1_9ACTN|nr:LysM peptidoglycan-binding domain-containing protein [Embleya hyalina]GCE01791.1 peptidase M23 [Embleya hyalina]